MNKKIIVIIVAVLIIIAGFLYFYYSGFFSKLFYGNPNSRINANQIILFYGENCPHCKIVDEYIKTKNIEQKIQFTKLEVFQNKDNAQFLLGRATACGLETEAIGVPFLWTGSVCVLGDEDVIKFFEEKIK